MDERRATSTEQQRSSIVPPEAIMTTPDQLRAIVDYLQNRVQLAQAGERTIVFGPPGAEEMISEGLDEATVRRLVAVPWWSEMVDDVVETPDFAEPGATPDVVLEYARDVVQEYIGKRFPLEG
jgi:hypothetical protein